MPFNGVLLLPPEMFIHDAICIYVEIGGRLSCSSRYMVPSEVHLLQYRWRVTHRYIFCRISQITSSSNNSSSHKDLENRLLGQDDEDDNEEEQSIAMGGDDPCGTAGPDGGGGGGGGDEEGRGEDSASRGRYGGKRCRAVHIYTAVVVLSTWNENL